MSQVQTHSRATAAYRDAEAHPPARQIALLHESAIRNLLDAKLAIAQRRIEDRFHRVVRAHAIVGALQACLDFELGGEIAPSARPPLRPYAGPPDVINLHDDPAICDEIVHLLTRMRDGWAEIASGTVPPGSVPLRPASPRFVRRAVGLTGNRAGRGHTARQRPPPRRPPQPSGARTRSSQSVMHRRPRPCDCSR